jgi:hypothetical protein
MANNYLESSSFLKLPEEKIEQAKVIVDRVIKELEESEEEYCGCNVKVESEGVWFGGDEYCNVEHVEQIAKALVEELEIDEPFFCSWAYTCSKPRVDEFGGGAFVVQRGKETYWIDAMNHVQEFVGR